MSIVLSSNFILSSNVDSSVHKVMPEFMKMKVDLKLGGKDIFQSIQKQWERFIKHHPREIDFKNVSNSLDAFYVSFVKEIAEIRKDNKGIFQKFLQKQNDSNLLGQRFVTFLQLPKVKAAFMVLGEDVIWEMQGSPKEIIEPVIPKKRTSWSPKTNESALSEEQIVEELLNENVDVAHPTAADVSNASKFLGLHMGEQISNSDIANACSKKISEIMTEFQDMPEKQEKYQKAAEIAQKILSNTYLITVPQQVVTQDQIEAAKQILDIMVNGIPTKHETEKAYRKKLQHFHGDLNDSKNKEFLSSFNRARDLLLEAAESNISTGPGVIVPNEFRKMVLEKGMEIAQQLIEQGGSMNDMMNALQSEKSSSDISDEDMAYFMGYVQKCILLLKKSPKVLVSQEVIQQISNIAQVLKSLNAQVA